MTRDATPSAPHLCVGESCEGPVLEAFPARNASLGALQIRRALPVRQHRLIGPWCFLDSYGPLSFTAGKPMDVAPHPHIGLQTVSWLLEGEVLHRDSLGNENLVRPGELNLMTSGGGIAHSEETPRSHSSRLNGVQLWVALPDTVRNGPASFEHHVRLPRLELPGAIATIIAGELAGMRSPASMHSPLLGADVVVQSRSSAVLPLDPLFEHAVYVLEGTVTIEGQQLQPDVLYYLGVHRDELALASRDGARLLLLGGVPFGEPVLMWWNFVARTHEEIVAARTRWMDGSSFGTVPGYDGPPIPAPPLHGRAAPNPAS